MVYENKDCMIAGDIELNPGPKGTPNLIENVLSIYHGNIRSLRNKINYIANLIEEFDKVFVTETHLNNQIIDDDIVISGFDVPFRKDRNSHEGGIIIYHKSNINILRRVDLEHEHIESMWFELKTKVHPILININYRSELQSHTFDWQLFYLMLKQALDENSHFSCLGDLNKSFMINLPTTINDIVVVNGLVNIIDKPTHFDKHTGNISLLDPILIADSIQAIESVMKNTLQL
jgi:hypothetical protein